MSSSAYTLSSDIKPLHELRPLDPIDSALTAPGAPFELTHQLIDGRVQAVYACQRFTVRDLVLTSWKTYPRRTHIVYGDVRLTYADSYAQATTLAHALRLDYGVRKGDRIAVTARNTPHFCLTVLAAYLLGAIIVPINAFAEGPTLAYCIQDCDARIVVCDVERWGRLNDPAIAGGIHSLASKCTALKAIIVSPWLKDVYVPLAQRDWLQSDRVLASTSTNALAIADWDDLFTRAASYPTTAPFDDITMEDYIMIMYTSGTTGMPKGVVSKHRQVLGVLGVGGIHVARAFLRRGQTPPAPPAPDVWDEDACPSTLTLSPLFHVTGLQSGFLSATISGGRIVLLPLYEPRRALDVIRKERVKLVSGIGFMVRECIRLARPGDLDSLEAMSHGGASAANEIPSETQQKKRGVAASTGYGMTECNGLVLGAFLDEYAGMPDSIGHPVPGVDVLIVDPDTGRVLPDGQPGELLIRSPCNADGYWRRPKETAATFLADGFLRTGDLARRDKNGYVFVLDRIKDMIIRGGENVSCASVEGAIYSDPRVLECAAVGVPDERLGERVGLIVVSNDPIDLDAVQAIGRAKGLPKFAIPEMVWSRKAPLEKNANGKVVKSKLRGELQAWLASQRSRTGTPVNIAAKL